MTDVQQILSVVQPIEFGVTFVVFGVTFIVFGVAFIVFGVTFIVSCTADCIWSDIQSQSAVVTSLVSF